MREHHKRCVEHRNADDGPLRSCVARLMEQTWKIALVLHAATHGAKSHEITMDRDTAERAVVLQQWFARQQMQILGGHVSRTGMTRLSKLCDLLRSASAGEMSLRDLKNSHGFPDAEVRKLVESALQQLNLQKRQNPGGGRPS